MKDRSPTDITALLEAAGRGDGGAAEQLTPTIYSELEGLAGSYLRRERAGHTLQPSDLVHEAFLRLAGAESANDRNHFVALAATSMRRVLVDHARRRSANKRGSGANQVTLSTALFSADARDVEVLDIDRALHELSRIDEQSAKLVELRYFGGLTCEEVAEVLGVSLTSVERKWRTTRLWLRRKLRSTG